MLIVDAAADDAAIIFRATRGDYAAPMRACFAHARAR